MSRAGEQRALRSDGHEGLDASIQQRAARHPDSSGSEPPAPRDDHLAALLPPDVNLRTEKAPGETSGQAPEEVPGEGLRHPAAREVWFGVVWGRLGRGDLAAAWFDRVAEPSLQPWIAAERGRMLRELGDHAAAAAGEEPALDIAADPVDRGMLLISLAADAVGHGEAAAASERLAAARRVLQEEAPPGPRTERQRLRAGWVALEIALLTGRVPDDTSDLPELAANGSLWVPDRYAAGSRFHLAKGLLFAGVVRGDLRLLDLALGHAPPALWWAVQLARAAAGVDGAEVAGQRARAAIVPLPR